MGKMNLNAGASGFSMDAFMANIQKSTKAKPARQKTAGVPEATIAMRTEQKAHSEGNNDSAFLMPECSQIDAKSTQEKQNPVPENHITKAQCTTIATAAQENIGGTIQSTMRVKQAVEEQNAVQDAADERQRVAAYIRVSSDSSDQENSYEAQERYFSRLLASNPSWISVGIYSDFGITGTSKDKRVGFQRLLRHCKEGRIDRIVCKSISRFTRNTADFLTAMQVLRECNVTIYFEKECLDTANPMNDFVVTTLAAVAQQESFSISENLQLGIDKHFQSGEAPNKDIYGYRFNGKTVAMDSGYKYRDVDIVEDEAKIIRRIFNEVASGSTFADIARALNRDGVPAPKAQNSKKKGKGALKESIDQGWTAVRISELVKNERYTGEVVLQKTFTNDCLTHKQRVNNGEKPQYVLRNHHPAIINRELFDCVAEKLSLNKGKNAPVKGDYVLSGLLICGHCGRALNVRNARKPIWFCPSTALNNGMRVCDAERVYEKQVELMLRKAISERFDDIAKVNKVTDEKAKAGANNAVGSLQAVIEAYAASKTGLVAKMQARLEAVQKNDSTERDRTYIGKQLAAVRLGNESIQKRIEFLTTQKKAMIAKKELLQDGSVTDEDIAAKAKQIEIERQRLDAGKTEEAEVVAQMEELESYWEELEENYTDREKAIEWMQGQQGMTEREFYAGLLDHAKAFVRSITVYSARHFTVQWFDGSASDVQLDSNVDEGIHKKN